MIAVQVSLALAGDAPEVAALLTESATPFNAEEELERRYAKVWVARMGAGGELCGVALSWEVADEVQLIELFVASSARRQGVGGALLGALLDDGKTRGFALAVLEVRRDNAAALALYSRFGFAVVGERAKYYVDGEDAILMRRELGTTQ